MNHRAENKLSYLEKLRSGRQRSPAGFQFSPLVPVSAPWLPTLHGSLGRSKVRLPLRSGRGHTSQQNDTLAFNLGAPSNKQGEARTQATCPLSVQGADSAPNPAGTNSDRRTPRDRRPRARTPHSTGVLGSPTLRQDARWGPGRPMGHPQDCCPAHGLHPPRRYPLSTPKS